MAFHNSIIYTVVYFFPILEHLLCLQISTIKSKPPLAPKTHCEGINKMTH